jgi:hypothetical protein
LSVSIRLHNSTSNKQQSSYSLQREPPKCYMHTLFPLRVLYVLRISSFFIQLKYTMKNSPRVAGSSSANQKMTHLLWSPKVHYHMQNNLLMDPILCQINPVHTLAPFFLKIHLNIILQTVPRSSKLSLSLRFCKNFSSLPHMLHYKPKLIRCRIKILKILNISYFPVSLA